MRLVAAIVGSSLSLQACDATEPGSGDGAAPAIEAAERPPGRWLPAPERAATGPPGERAEDFALLEAIGYLAGYSPATGRAGVTRHDPVRAHQGLNFYVSGHAPEAILMDMDGEVLHRWRRSIREVWPHLEVDPKHEAAHHYRRALLLPNGDILAILAGYGLIKLDKDSRLLWSYDGRAHHDLEILPDGRIVTLTREARLRPEVNPAKPIVEDFAVVLSPEGEEILKVSVLDALRNAGPAFSELIARVPREGDLLHTNSLQVLDGRIAKHVPAFAAGNLLISFRRTSTVAVLDLEQRKVVWARQGPWKVQHHPRVLDDRRILIFNNRAGKTTSGRISSVIEFDVVDEEVGWSLRGSEALPFYSALLGAAHRLPNGNTLIIESDRGRGFEVSAEKDVVWEFYSPHRAGEQGELVAALLDIVRLPPDFPTDWIARD